MSFEFPCKITQSFIKDSSVSFQTFAPAGRVAVSLLRKAQYPFRPPSAWRLPCREPQTSYRRPAWTRGRRHAPFPPPWRSSLGAARWFSPGPAEGTKSAQTFFARSLGSRIAYRCRHGKQRYPGALTGTQQPSLNGPTRALRPAGWDRPALVFLARWLAGNRMSPTQRLPWSQP